MEGAGGGGGAQRYMETQHFVQQYCEDGLCLHTSEITTAYGLDKNGYAASVYLDIYLDIYKNVAY